MTQLPQFYRAVGAGYSPDGGQIAFMSDSVSATYLEKVWKMRASPGVQPTLLCRVPDGQATGTVSWSPDGSRIAFGAVEIGSGGMTGKIYIVSAEGGAACLFAGGPGEGAWNPAWSPDGSLIAYDMGGASGIWTKPVSGGPAVRITENGMGPAWSPDGSRIAFARVSIGPSHIWTMSSTGQDQAPLTFGATIEGQPAWSGDGRRIAYRISSVNYVGDIWVLYLPSL